MRFLSRRSGKNKRIRVIGDYDIDGVERHVHSAGEGSSELGADVDTDIPDRIRDGSGPEHRLLIDRAISTTEESIPIITCDNGIAAADEIAYGKKNWA